MITTKYRIKGDAYWLDSNLQKVDNMANSATFSTLEDVDTALTTYGSAEVVYEVVLYKGVE